MHHTPTTDGAKKLAERGYGPGAYAKREGAFIRAGLLMAAAPRVFVSNLSVEIRNVDTGERWLTSEFGLNLRRTDA